MAWVRIDDQAPRHEKMLEAGPSACWLWVCALAHCQSQLTDGFVSDAVLPMIGVLGAARCRKLADVLITAGLFDKVDGGYKVHDYLAHNQSRAAVLEKRAEDAKRKRAAESGRTPDGNATESGAPRARIPSHPIPTEPNRNKEPTARSKRPIFKGQRFTVFEWQLDDLSRMLGAHVEAFDLHAWFFDLDAQVHRTGEVIPQRDGGAWLQARTLAEATRRGLPVAIATTHSSKTAGNLAALQRFAERETA